MTSFISNAFQIPNDLIDNGHMAKMKGAALPCYLLIVRKTRGWNKQADSISLSQFVKATGYNKDTVQKGLLILEEMGVIIRLETDKQINEWSLTDQIITTENHTKNSPSENLAMLKNSTEPYENLVSNHTKNSPHNNNNKNKEKQGVGYSENFEKFWSAYPTCKRKSDKSGTYKTFTKHEGSFAIETLLSVLEKQKSDVSWTKQDGEFIPSPSAWLNQKQWENEYWFQVNSPVVAPDFSNAQLQYGDW
ncbi:MULTISPECIES: replication protein [Acinetobacter]|uniref:replication protein n=1 Tax=Acinetobacter TaxID=469 RepID=UPI0003F76C1B|nr:MULTISPECIES: replication protein [Acinetobacter]AIL79060.1 replication protein [Acinetobacter baumannii]AIS07656.1 replication protein [Acinetobacter baumannii]ATD20130.1 replication protein [Acinetobacter baumannii]AVO89859.1 replication protein [Acinetobacter baumannii]AXG83893.1 replication protein [Acinetobacter baumannii]